MLIKVTVENFKSFSEPTEMTMISSTKNSKKALIIGLKLKVRIYLNTQ